MSKTPVKRIYLDLDDVLNNMTFTILDDLGCNLNTSTAKYPREHRPRIAPIANALLGANIYTDGFIDRLVFVPTLWERIKLSSHALELVKLCATLVGRDNVFILSASTGNPDFNAAKEKWINENLPEWLHNQTIFTKCKSCCAAADALLIDDSPANTVSFRQAGGQAVLFPRPWNKFYFVVDPAQYVFKVLENLFPGQRCRDVGLSPKWFYVSTPSAASGLLKQAAERYAKLFRVKIENDLLNDCCCPGVYPTEPFQVTFNPVPAKASEVFHVQPSKEIDWCVKFSEMVSGEPVRLEMSKGCSLVADTDCTVTLPAHAKVDYTNERFQITV